MRKFSDLEQRLRKLANNNQWSKWREPSVRLSKTASNVDVDMFETCVHRARAMPGGVSRDEAIQTLVESGVPEDIATYAVVAAEILNEG